MSTARDLIKDALLNIGAIASGETPSADEQADSLRTLNRMIDGWSNEKLLIFQEVRETFTLIAGQQAYTVGDGGDFDTTRPIKLDRAGILLSEDNEVPITLLNQDQWADLTLKNTQSSIPRKIYRDGGYPLLTIRLWPVPSEAVTLVLYPWRPLSSFASANTEVSFPPGYEDAIVNNLSVRLCPQFSRPVTTELKTLADDSKAVIKIANIKPQYLHCDPATLNCPSSVDIFSGRSW